MRRESQRRWEKANPERVRASKQRYRAANKERLREASRNYKARNRDAIWAADLRRLYDLSPEDYAQLFERQSGACAVCREKPSAQRLAVDHDHNSGRVRGLLCRVCNTALGAFCDSPERFDSAAAYLRKEGT